MGSPGSTAVWWSWLSLQDHGWHASQVTSLPTALYISLPFFPVFLSCHNMKWQGWHKNHSGLDFFTLFLNLDLLQTLFDNLFYISALWALGFHVPVSTVAEPVTLGTLCSGTEMELLGLDYQDKKLYHFGNLPGSEYELNGPKVSKSA